MYRRLLESAHRAIAPLGLVFVLLLSSGAAAQPEGFEAQNLHISTRQTNSHAAFPVADVPERFNWEAGLLFQFAQNGIGLTFNERGEDGQIRERDVAIVKSQILANLWGSVAVASRLEIGAEIPIYLGQTTEDTEVFTDVPGADPSAGIGDPRITAKALLFDLGADDQVGFAMSVGADLFIPLGDEENLQGEDVRGEFSLLNTIQIPGGYRVTFKGGYYVRPSAGYFDFDIGDMVTYGLGVLIPVTEEFELDVDIFGGSVIGAEDFGTEDSPLEALATARYLHESGFFVQGNVGTFLVSGFGVPTIRGGIAVGIGTSPVVDSDRDRYPDEVDQCPNEPEDYDGVLDGDGCPDPDNDRDGIPDVDDECPNRSGPEDNNGCPREEEDIIDYQPRDRRERRARDSDNDGIADYDDQCPNEPETQNGYLDADGCPDEVPEDEDAEQEAEEQVDPTDRDGDGLENSMDFCPDEAEDFDGILDDDGCPEDDADYDGVPDEDDACPMVEAQEDEDGDGCPD
jgi:hypothetical protein